MSSWPVSTVLSTETILEAKTGSTRPTHSKQIFFASKKRVSDVDVVDKSKL